MKKRTPIAAAFAILATLALSPFAYAAEDNAPKGNYVELKCEVAADATGAMTYYYQALKTPDGFKFEENDFLEYDVLISEKTGGFGGLDIYNPEGGTLRDDPTCADQNIVQAHPQNSIALYAYNKWYSRKINISPSLIYSESNPRVGPHYVLFVAQLPDIGTLAGKTVSAKFANIRITRNGETVCELFTDKTDAFCDDAGYFADLKGNDKVKTTLEVVKASAPDPSTPESSEPSEPSQEPSKEPDSSTPSTPSKEPEPSKPAEESKPTPVTGDPLSVAGIVAVAVTSLAAAVVVVKKKGAAR